MLSWIAGPVHMDDLLYLFPQNHMLPNMKLTPEDEDMVDTMTSLWVNFAQTGYVRHVLYFSLQLIH
jgi:carboxylesterase type B